MSALESRHLADLRFAEVTRALRALSSAYVERRHKVASGSTLDSAGKRAAFALYYGPLHFIATQHVLNALDARAPSHVLDLGCGTGTVGAAWALTSRPSPAVMGIDRHPWAVEEAKRTYRDLGVNGRARTGDIARLPEPRGSSAVVAGYVLNELPEAVRVRVENQIVAHAQAGGSVLILEPIARSHHAVVGCDRGEVCRDRRTCRRVALSGGGPGSRGHARKGRGPGLSRTPSTNDLRPLSRQVTIHNSQVTKKIGTAVSVFSAL